MNADKKNERGEGMQDTNLVTMVCELRRLYFENVLIPRAQGIWWQVGCQSMRFAFSAMNMNSCTTEEYYSDRLMRQFSNFYMVKLAIRGNTIEIQREPDVSWIASIEKNYPDVLPRSYNYFDLLPTEIIATIAEFLSSARDLGAFMCVSKRINSVAPTVCRNWISRTYPTSYMLIEQQALASKYLDIPAIKRDVYPRVMLTNNDSDDEDQSNDENTYEDVENYIDHIKSGTTSAMVLFDPKHYEVLERDCDQPIKPTLFLTIPDGVEIDWDEERNDLNVCNLVKARALNTCFFSIRAPLNLTHAAQRIWYHYHVPHYHVVIYETTKNGRKRKRRHLNMNIMRNSKQPDYSEHCHHFVPVHLVTNTRTMKQRLQKLRKIAQRYHNDNFVSECTGMHMWPLNIINARNLCHYGIDCVYYTRPLRKI